MTSRNQFVRQGRAQGLGITHFVALSRSFITDPDASAATNRTRLSPYRRGRLFERMVCEQPHLIEVISINIVYDMSHLQRSMIINLCEKQASSTADVANSDPVGLPPHVGKWEGPGILGQSYLAS